MNTDSERADSERADSERADDGSAVTRRQQERADELLAQAVEEQLEEQRAMRRLVDRVDETMTWIRSNLDQLAQSAEPWATILAERHREIVTDEAGRSREAVAEQLEEVRAEAREQIETARLASAAQVGELRSTVTEQMQTLVAQLGRAVGDTQESLESVGERSSSVLQSLLDQVSALGESYDERLRALLTTTEETLAAGARALTEHSEAAANKLVEQSDAVTARLTGAADDLAARAAEAQERGVYELREAAEQVQGVGDQAVDAVEARLGTALADFRALTERLEELDRSERNRAELEGQALADLREGLRDGVEQILTGLHRDVRAEYDRLAERTEEVVGRLDTAGKALRSELRRTVKRAHGEGVGEITAAAEELAAAAPRMEAAAATELAAVQAQLDGLSERVEATVTAFTGHIGTAEQLQNSLVGYLAARDKALEVERGRILREVLEEFAGSLSRREAKRLAERLDEARQRTRDRHDAEALREGEAATAPGAAESDPAADLDAWARVAAAQARRPPGLGPVVHGPRVADPDPSTPGARLPGEHPSAETVGRGARARAAGRVTGEDAGEQDGSLWDWADGGDTENGEWADDTDVADSEDGEWVWDDGDAEEDDAEESAENDAEESAEDDAEEGAGDAGDGVEAPDLDDENIDWSVTCGHCGFVAKTPPGLGVHRRIHIR